jgi:hypothetical protein
MVGGEWTKQRMIARQSICGQSYSMGRETFARQRHHVRRKSISSIVEKDANGPEAVTRDGKMAYGRECERRPFANSEAGKRATAER